MVGFAGHNRLTNTGQYATVVRVNVSSPQTITGVVSTGQYICTQLAFDDELLGPDTVLCMASSFNSYTTQVMVPYDVASLSLVQGYWKAIHRVNCCVLSIAH